MEFSTYAECSRLHGCALNCGPLHTLELSHALRLSDEQTRQLTLIRKRMLGKAKPLGAELVEAERELEALFAGGHPSKGKVEAATSRIADLEGRMCAVHLRAHLEQLRCSDCIRKRFMPGSMAIHQEPGMTATVNKGIDPG